MIESKYWFRLKYIEGLFWFLCCYYVDKDCCLLLDMVFIVDLFVSIGKINWERIKRFLKVLVSKLDVSFGCIYVVVVVYSIDFIVIMRFKDV